MAALLLDLSILSRIKLTESHLSEEKAGILRWTHRRVEREKQLRKKEWKEEMSGGGSKMNKERNGGEERSESESRKRRD